MQGPARKLPPPSPPPRSAPPALPGESSTAPRARQPRSLDLKRLGAELDEISTVQRGAAHALAIDGTPVGRGEVLETQTPSRNVSCACRRETLGSATTTSHAGWRPISSRSAVGAIQHQQHRQLRRHTESGSGTHAGQETVPRASARVERSRSGAAQCEVADQLLLVDQLRPEQQPEPVNVRLLAEQPFRERGVQDPRETLT